MGPHGTGTHGVPPFFLAEQTQIVCSHHPQGSHPLPSSGTKSKSSQVICLGMGM